MIQSKYPKSGIGLLYCVTLFSTKTASLWMACRNSIRVSSNVYRTLTFSISLLRHGKSTDFSSILLEQIIHLAKSSCVIWAILNFLPLSPVWPLEPRNIKKSVWTSFTDGSRTNSFCASVILPKRIRRRMGQCISIYWAVAENRYRRYPGWIKAIWIRIVEGVDLSAEKKLNAPERFQKAFEGVPPQAWTTFKDPKDLYAFAL